MAKNFLNLEILKRGGALQIQAEWTSNKPKKFIETHHKLLKTKGKENLKSGLRKMTHCLQG